MAHSPGLRKPPKLWTVWSTKYKLCVRSQHRPHWLARLGTKAEFWRQNFTTLRSGQTEGEGCAIIEPGPGAVLYGLWKKAWAWKANSVLIIILKSARLNPLYFEIEKLTASLHGLVCANCPPGHRPSPCQDCEARIQYWDWHCIFWHHLTHFIPALICPGCKSSATGAQNTRSWNSNYAKAKSFACKSQHNCKQVDQSCCF